MSLHSFNGQITDKMHRTSLQGICSILRMGIELGWGRLVPPYKTELTPFHPCVILSVVLRCQVLPNTVGGWPLLRGAASFAPGRKKGGGAMVTYSELFQFCILIVSIIGLVIQATKKK